MRRIVFVEGLPGAGKSSLTRALGQRIPGSTTYFETEGTNPFHVAALDDMGASFSEINSVPPGEIATRSLLRWIDFARAASEGLHIVESYPLQSGARLLLQVDATEAEIHAYLAALFEAVAAMRPIVVLLDVGDMAMHLETIAELRGPEWTHFVHEFTEQTPRAQSRGLRGRDAAFGLVAGLQRVTEGFLSETEVPWLKVPGGAEYGAASVSLAESWIRSFD